MKPFSSMIIGTGTIIQSLLALMSSNSSSSSIAFAIALSLALIYFSVYLGSGYFSPSFKSFFSGSFFNSFGIVTLGLGNMIGFCAVEVMQSKTMLSLY